VWAALGGSAGGQECLSWQRRIDAPMSPRERHAMAYDLRRGVTVLFGGRYFSQPYGDTWEWDGDTWQQRDVVGPEARSEHAMVYDRGRGVTVLFGGTAPGVQSATANALVIFGDTWEWDGEKWVQRSNEGPEPRLRAAMAYDSRREVVVLFGGLGEFARLYGNTWEWDGHFWQLRSTEGPSNRAHASMAYDEDRGVTVLFGGGDHHGLTNDTWEWNGSDWTRISAPSSPLPRTGHGQVYDRGRRVSVLFGGSVGVNEPRGDVWLWDGAGWAASAIPAPSARAGHGMVYDSRRGNIVVFGGDPGLLDTWEFLTCRGDADDDGVADGDDECPGTVLGDRVMVGDCDTGVADQVLGNGCTMTELIASCKPEPRPRSRLLRCVIRLVRDWRREGIIHPSDGGKIIRCAARRAHLRGGRARP
jgi:hypothetical protein